MVVNEFDDFDEGPALLDLYFGGNRPSLLLNALYVGLFYAASLLLALYFLQPRGSRLRVLEENPALSRHRERLSASALGLREAGRSLSQRSLPQPSDPPPAQQQAATLGLMELGRSVSQRSLQPPPDQPPPPQQQQLEMQQQVEMQLHQLTTTALEPEGGDKKSREYYNAFETASAGVGIVVGGGGGVFKRGAPLGGAWGQRGEETKDAARAGGGSAAGWAALGGGAAEGNLRKSSADSRLLVETFDGDGYDGDGPLYYLEEGGKVSRAKVQRNAPISGIFIRRSTRCGTLFSRSS